MFSLITCPYLVLVPWYNIGTKHLELDFSVGVQQTPKNRLIWDEFCSDVVWTEDSQVELQDIKATHTFYIINNVITSLALHYANYEECDKGSLNDSATLILDWSKVNIGRFKLPGDRIDPKSGKSLALM